MELDLDDNQTLFTETGRRFLEQVCPIPVLRARYERGEGIDLTVWRQAADLGWTAALVPEPLHGGSVSGSGLRDLALVAEELGRIVAPLPLLPVNVVLDTLGRSHNATAHAEVVPSLLGGEALAAWGHDEGTGTWADNDVATTAAEDGDGWILNGTKCFVEEADKCRWFLISARTPTGLCQFLVPADAGGVTVSVRESLDLGRQLGDVHFAGVRVDSEALIGADGDAAPDLARQLQLAVVLQNAETVGALDRVLAMTLEYASDRVAFGRPLSSFQALKHRFADMKMWVEACMATSNASASALADESRDAAELVAAARCYIAAKAPSIVQDCIQLHGGIGVTWEHDLHLYLRRVTQNVTLYGSLRHHREQLARIIGDSHK